MNKGFHYTLDTDSIKEYMKLTTEQKLSWLEEIFLFSEETISAKAKKMRKYFKNKTDIADDKIIHKTGNN